MKRAVVARQSFFTLTEYVVRMILADFWLLEKTRIRLWRNSFLRFNRAQGAKLAVAAALGALFAAGDFWFFRRILYYFNTLPVDVGEILVIQMLNLLCLTFFSMLVFSNVITSISTMFLSRDLDLLVSSPIPTRQLFLSRYVGTLINSSWMAALFMIPALCAFGEVAYAPYGYYALMLALLPPFLLIPACAGTLVTMLLMRYFPARRAHQILSFVGMIFIAGLVMVIRFMEPEKYLGRKVSDEAIIGFVESLKAPDYPWLPSSMTARALQLASVDDFAGAFWPAAVLWFIAVAALAFVVAVAGGVYYRGWSAAYGSERTMMSRRRGGLFYRLLGALLSRAGHDTRALAMKDMKIFWRDTGQWSQLFMLGALVVVYLFNIRNLPLTTMALKNVVSVMNIGLAGVVLAAVAARFVFPTTSVEGASFWAIKSAPLRFSRFLWAKFFFFLAPLLLLAEILVVASNLLLDVDAYVMAVSAGAVGLLTIGLTGLGVGMGAMYPKFDYENIAEVGVTTGAVIYMIIALAYAGVTVMLCARPVYVHLYFSFTGVDIGGPEVYASYAGIVVITLLFIFIPLRKGAQALERIEI